MTTDLYRWAAGLDTLLAEVWARLAQGVADNGAAARHPTFATLSPSGWPQMRSVVLRATDSAAGTLDIHTDLRSGKVAHLRHSPRAGLHVWDASVALQTRIDAEVDVLSHDAAAAAWARVPDASRELYGTTPAPGVPIAGSLAYAKAPDPDCFAVLRCRVLAIDAVHLGPQHRRARFEVGDDWAGQWLSP